MDKPFFKAHPGQKFLPKRTKLLWSPHLATVGAGLRAQSQGENTGPNLHTGLAYQGISRNLENLCIQEDI